MTGSAAVHPAATDGAALAAAAMADAIRHNLTFPGSVPPAEQFRLTLADRAANDQPVRGTD
jgi:hypothetical protein